MPNLAHRVEISISKINRKNVMSCEFFVYIKLCLCVPWSFLTVLNIAISVIEFNTRIWPVVRNSLCIILFLKFVFVTSNILPSKWSYLEQGIEYIV